MATYGRTTAVTVGKQLSTSSIGNALDELSFPEAFMDELVDAACDDSPNTEVWPIRHVDGLEPWIGGQHRVACLC